MTHIAAIDVGSNAMRLAVARLNGEAPLKIVESSREAVRLGADVFATGAVGPDTAERTVAAFKRFRERLDALKVQHVVAVGTSALREARNRDELLQRIAAASGVAVQVIAGDEEARLIVMAVTERLALHDRLALMIDIGGGSVEVSLVESAQIVSSESYKLGTVRLLRVLDEQHQGERKFNRMVQEYVESARRRIRNEVGRRRLDLCIGTGGNIEALGALRVQLLDQSDPQRLTVDELDELVRRLQALSYDERVSRLGLRPDRADVIVPAAIVLKNFVQESGAREIVIPAVGLKDGVLIDLKRQIDGGSDPRKAQVLASARALGQKYRFDEVHAQTVAAFALQLFADTARLHGLSDTERLWLEVAALLHDIGQFVDVNGHHKHSAYLIRNSPIVGLTAREKDLVAHVARYHRKSPPKPSHSEFRALPKADQKVVLQLAAILRLANALDAEHGNKVSGVRLKLGQGKAALQLDGSDDMYLEAWALEKRGEMFEEVLGVKLSVER